MTAALIAKLDIVIDRMRHNAVIGDDVVADARDALAALWQDAERYRWLRSHPEWAQDALTDINEMTLDTDVCAALDAAIDAITKDSA